MEKTRQTGKNANTKASSQKHCKDGECQLKDYKEKNKIKTWNKTAPSRICVNSGPRTKGYMVENKET